MPAGRWGSSLLRSGVMLRILARSILPRGTLSSARPTDRESASIPVKYLLTVRFRKFCRSAAAFFPAVCSARMSLSPVGRMVSPAVFFMRVSSAEYSLLSWMRLPEIPLLPSLQDASSRMIPETTTDRNMFLFMFFYFDIVVGSVYFLTSLMLFLLFPLFISRI